MGTPAIHPASPVDRFLLKAQRRRLLALVAQQLPVVTGSLLAAVVLVLLLGTKRLTLLWWLSSAAALLAFVLIRLHRKRLGAYQLAQVIDNHLGTSDALATAWFILHEQCTQSAAARTFQLAGAEKIVQSADPSRLFPLGSNRRSWLAPLGLCAIVIGLLGSQLFLVPSQHGPASLLRTQRHKLSVNNDTSPGVTTKPQQTKKEDAASLPEIVNGLIPPSPAEAGELKPPTAPAAAIPEGGKSSNDGKAGASASASHADGRTPDANSASNLKEQARGSGQGSSENPAQTSEHLSRPKDAKEHASNAGSGVRSSDENGTGALTRMKEALSSLLSKLEGNKGRNSSSNQNSTESQKAQNASGNQNGTEQGKTGKEEGGAQSPSEEGKSESANGGTGEPMNASSRSQAAGSGNSDTSNANRNEDQQGGAGHQNGDKSLHTAEQLQALGKLQQILGKRAEQVTGEMSVETSSGTQRLQTEYSGKTALHKDLGGEIHKQEVPLELQNYVKGYMTHVHDDANRAR